MGRVRRYKRIKAIDPFSKTGGVVDHDKGKVFNKAPTRKDMDAVPRSMQLLFDRRAAGGLTDGAPPPSRARAFSVQPKALPVKAFAHVSALPGESLQAYGRRVDAERSTQLAGLRQGALDAKPTSAKRKAYQKKQAERRRLRGTGAFDEETRHERWEAEQEEKLAAREAARRGGGGAGAAAAAGHKRPRSDSGAGEEEESAAPQRQARSVIDFPSASGVAFGERAMEPPKLTVAPRKSQVRRGVGGRGCEDPARALSRCASAQGPCVQAPLLPPHPPAQKQKMREALRAAQAKAVAVGSAPGASDDAIASAEAARDSLAAQRAAEAQQAQMASYRASVVSAYAELKKRKKEAHSASVHQRMMSSGGGSGGGGGGGGTHRPRAKKQKGA